MKIANFLLAFALHIWAAESALLFGGHQDIFLPTNTPANCVQAFNKDLACDSKVQLLYKQTDWVGWNASDLTALCRPACKNDLASLKTTVASACGSFPLPLAGENIDAATLVEAIRYHYDLACLADGATFCHRQLYDWNIANMVAAKKATWPKNTNKQYYDWENDPISGSLALDYNNVEIQPWEVVEIEKQLPSKRTAAMDDEYIGGQRPSPNLGYDGGPLEYDEFPLEIQCSKCFLDRFKLGFQREWGETYDEVTAQIWRNMQLNCGLKETLTVHPALNQSGPPDESRPPLIWTAAESMQCDRHITVTTPWGKYTNCSSLAQQYSVPVGALMQMNEDIYCPIIEDGTYCFPKSCKIYTNTETFMTGTMLLQKPQFQNISLVMLATWNPYTTLDRILDGETVCVAPPDGLFVPSTPVAVAKPSVYTKTAVPASPTPPGTIKNCGFYHDTIAGDDCSMLSMNYTITFDQFVAMNPDIDSVCTNLEVGRSYCVGLVNGTTVTPPTTTKQPATTSIPGANGIATPQPAQPGMALQCNAFAKVATGDTCQTIAVQKGVSTSDIFAWNSGVGDMCQTLWSGYYICVGVVGSSTKPVTSTSAGAAPAPGPTQAGIIGTCRTYLKANVGGTCPVFADRAGITTAQLYAWNPILGSNGAACATSFWGDTYYCVGVAAPPGPVQEGISLACENYLMANPGGSCPVFAERAGISLANLYAWNPILGSNGDKCSSQFKGNTYYCVGVVKGAAAPATTQKPTTSGAAPAPGPTQTGIISTCKTYLMANTGGTCSIFASRAGISLAQLYAWNSVLGKSGENCATQFWGETYYCVGVSGGTVVPTTTQKPTTTGAAPAPGPTQTGIISTCKTYLKANTGGTCSAFASRAGISLAQLYAWNSVLGNNGQNCVTQFWGETYYCVGVSGSTVVTTPKPATTGAAPAPGPTQAGISNKCNKYLMANAGGTCPVFATRAGISLANLYAWNTVLGNNGQNCQTKFWGDTWYCVGVRS